MMACQNPFSMIRITVFLWCASAIFMLQLWLNLMSSVCRSFFFSAWCGLEKDSAVLSLQLKRSASHLVVSYSDLVMLRHLSNQITSLSTTVVTFLWPHTHCKVYSQHYFYYLFILLLFIFGAAILTKKYIDIFWGFYR